MDPHLKNNYLSCKMNRLTIFICILICCCGIHGQKAVKVEYDYHFFTVRGYETHRPMILTASDKKSKFYNPVTNMIDSTCNTPEGKAEYEAYINSVSITRDNIKSIPIRWEKMYVEKNRTDSILTVYDTVAGEDRYYYNEPLAGMNWEITDSVDVVLGLECQTAECDYHGRHWTAWFTPEVPLPDGPWKLNGLPGLILRAKEDSGQYEFTAVGIENYHKEIEPVYELSLYEKIDRKELLQTKRLIDENMGGFITARTGIDHPKNMSSLMVKKTYDYIETDYR